MNTIIKNKILSDEYLNRIKTFSKAEIYLVGGAVRDVLLGENTFDRDLIIVGEAANEFAQKVANNLDGTFIPLDIKNNIYRVVLSDKINYFDITNPVENSLEKDILRRDLTINSIAVNIRNFEIIDITNGIVDIKNGILRSISEQNIVDDPLRILRIFRFQALYGFEISDETNEFIIKYKNKVKEPAWERITYELLKLFGGKYCKKALLNMDAVGILEDFFPFVKELKQIPPNTHHHLDLFHHSLETMEKIQELYENSNLIIKNHLDKIDFGGFSRRAHLKLAGFMHDIGKFSTWTIEEDTGRHRFIKHDDVGAKMAPKVLKEMKFSNKQIEYIAFLIKNHIYPSQVAQVPDINEKVMMRFVRKAEANAIDNIYLAMADRLSARGPAITEEIVDNNIRGLNVLLEFYLEKKDTLQPLPILLNGHDIMEILGVKPSPLLGRILEELHEAQISGEIFTKEQAIDFVMSYKI